MKWIIRLLVILGVLILTTFITGSMLPLQHTASASQTFSASREDVWAVLTDFTAWPSWRTDLKGIRSDNNTFTEVGSDDEEIEYRIEELTPPERLVTRIITPDLPFGGSWTYELTPSGLDGCTLTITENGEVYNPLFRFMSKYMFGHEATMQGYLEDLKKRVE